MPTYSPNIPQPPDILSDSQDDILQNFQQINTVFAQNHIPFEAAGQGKHKEVTLPELVAPTPTLIDEANIYSQLSALTGETELFWQRENNGTRIEWTGLLATGNGWTRLPSGILLKWGGGAAVGFGFAVIYPIAATNPVFVNVFATFVTTRAFGGTDFLVNLVDGSQTNVNFNVNAMVASTGAAAASTFNYLSIGI